MRSYFKAVSAAALALSSPAYAQTSATEQDIPETLTQGDNNPDVALTPEEEEDKLVDLAISRMVPYKFVTVVPDFAVSMSLDIPAQLKSIETPTGKSPFTVKSVHLSAVFQQTQTQEYVSLDCKALAAISIENVKALALMKDDLARRLYRAQLDQFIAGQTALKCRLKAPT